MTDTYDRHVLPCLECAGVFGDNVRCMAATVPGHLARALELAAQLEEAHP